MTDPYPYPHDRLVRSRHAIMALVELLATESTDLVNIRALTLLLAPLGDAAAERAEEVVTVAGMAWHGDAEAQRWQTVLHDTATELYDAWRRLHVDALPAGWRRPDTGVETVLGGSS